MAGSPVFHWADYLVFAITLVMSSSIGVYYAYKDRKRCNMEEYLVGGRKMPVLPVTISLFVTYVSAISYLGDPVEAYYYGWMFMALGLGNALAMVLVAEVFAPLYHSSGIISVYEYMGKIYNYRMQMFGSAIFIVNAVMWLTFVLYSPALALSQVSGLPVWLTIVTLGGVSTFYTTLGGMKAVLWADTAQTMVMLAGLIAILVRGSMLIGGLDEIWKIAVEDDRLNLNFSPNPLVRSTFWTYFIGGFFRTLGPYVTGQYQTQRYCSVRTPKDATKAVYWNIPMFLIIIPLFSLVGQLMYAYYRKCDPLLEGRIERPDQMLPLMMVETLGPFPGLPGLFLAAVFSASLSSLSSGQTAIVACIIRDFIEPICGMKKKTPTFRLSDKTSNIVAKVTVVLLGFLLMGLAWYTMSIGGSIFQMSIKVTSIVSGPILGIFLLAVFCPSVSGLSAFAGLIVAFCLCSWIALGSTIYPPPDSKLPVDISNCSNVVNITLTALQSVVTEVNQTTVSETGASIYQLSPVLIKPFGTICSVFVSLALTGIAVGVQRLRQRRRYEVNQSVDKEQELDMLKKSDVQISDGKLELDELKQNGDPA